MRPVKLTAKDENFIIRNRNLLSSRELGTQLGVSRNIILRFLKKRGLSVSPEQSLIFKRRALTGKTTSTPEIDAAIKKCYLKLPVKTLAERLGRSQTFVSTRLRQLGLVIPPELIAQRKEDSRYEKGHRPANKGKKQREYMTSEAIARTAKTRFKKGEQPKNTKYDGHVSLRWHKKDKRYYLYIRIAAMRWQLLDRHIWEAAHGKIPAKHVIRHRDGDCNNNDLANLECISMRENMRRNSIQRYPVAVKTSIRLISKLNKTINNAQKHNERPE